MNNEPLVPPPAANSQHENFSSSAGHEWNNGVTRRSFLKRTGGATLATMVTWHGVSERLAAATGAGGAAGQSGPQYWRIQRTAPVDASGNPLNSEPYEVISQSWIETATGYVHRIRAYGTLLYYPTNFNKAWTIDGYVKLNSLAVVEERAPAGSATFTTYYTWATALTTKVEGKFVLPDERVKEAELQNLAVTPYHTIGSSPNPLGTVGAIVKTANGTFVSSRGLDYQMHLQINASGNRPSSVRYGATKTMVVSLVPK